MPSKWFSFSHKVISQRTSLGVTLDKYLYWVDSYCWKDFGAPRADDISGICFRELPPLGFPGGLAGKASDCNAGDPGSMPESGRSPEEGNGSPLQYSCLENPMDGGAWEAVVHGVAESDRTERLHFHFSCAGFCLPALYATLKPV